MDTEDNIQPVNMLISIKQTSSKFSRIKNTRTKPRAIGVRS